MGGGLQCSLQMLILNSLQKDLKQSKLVIYEKDKKIHSLKKDLKEKEETIKALEKKKKEYIVTI